MKLCSKLLFILLFSFHSFGAEISKTLNNIEETDKNARMALPEGFEGVYEGDLLIEHHNYESKKIRIEIVKSDNSFCITIHYGPPEIKTQMWFFSASKTKKFFEKKTRTTGNSSEIHVGFLKNLNDNSYYNFDEKMEEKCDAFQFVFRNNSINGCRIQKVIMQCRYECWEIKNLKKLNKKDDWDL